MDDRRFDALITSLTEGASRRGVLRSLGAGTLAAVLGRPGTEQAAEAKKKRKKKKKKKTKVRQCANGTRACGAQCIPQDACCNDADCANQEACVGGVCTGGGVVPECQSGADCAKQQACVNGTCVTQGCLGDADCRGDEVCQNGTCVPDVVGSCQGNGDCDLGEACLEGSCVFVQGTCAFADDHCSVEEAFCNPAAGDNCFCLQRLTGGVACIESFVPDAVCGECRTDAECLDIGGPETVCVAPAGGGCPCEPGLGICALLCEN